MDKYYGIDLHCSKINLAKVNPENGNLDGEVYSEFFENFNSPRDLLSFVENNIPSSSRVGISAPGVLDKDNLIVKSVNSSLGEKITLGKDLRDKGYDVTLENDVVSEGFASSMFGHGKKALNFVLATYSSGHNCVRVNDGFIDFNPEFGHQDYRGNVHEIICGCGIKGCLETYCSGKGAAKIAESLFRKSWNFHISNQFELIHQHKPVVTIYRKPLSETDSRDPNWKIMDLSLRDYNNKNNSLFNFEDLNNKDFEEKILSNISGKNVYDAYKANKDGIPQKFIRDSQVKGIANSLNRITVNYNPLDLIILKGGLTNAWEELFEPAIEMYSEIGLIGKNYLKKPEILKTNIEEIGIVGGVANYIKKKADRNF
jgi:hypothetical protein